VSHFTDCDEFLEKTADGATATLGGFAARFGDKALGWMGKHKALTGLGALGLGAAGTLGMGQMMGGDRPGDTLSYKINKGLFGLTDRIRADEQFGESFSKTMGSNAADTLSELARDIVSKSVDTLKDTLQLSPARTQIFNVLREEDPDLASADSQTLMEAYNTMSSIAPNLSTDKNAVKSVLRMAVISGGGLDYQTIKGIADAETAINKAKETPR
jgi:hypothetical protein